MRHPSSNSVSSFLHVNLLRQILLFLSLLLVSLNTISYASETAWSGQWDTLWRDGGARLSLTQDGDRVTGVYSLYDGRVEGVVKGRQLHGKWWQGDLAGDFLAIQSSDGLSFTARLDHGGWLAGVRVVDDDNFMGIEIDKSSPASTLYSFLMIMNAVGPSTMELKSEAALLIDWSTIDDIDISPIDYTELLFNILDTLTFRSRTLRHASTGDTFQAVLPQAGTDKTFTLDFIKIDSEWLIKPVPSRELQADLARLRSDNRFSSKILPFSTPRASFKTLMLQFDQSDSSSLDRVAGALDLSELSELSKRYETRRLAGYLQRALSRAVSPIWQEVPDDPGSLKPVVLFAHPQGEIKLAPVQTEDGVIWQFTPDTLRNIRSLYNSIDDLPEPNNTYSARDRDLYFIVRDYFSTLGDSWTKKIGPMGLWQWVGLGVSLTLALGMARWVSILIGAPLMRLLNKSQSEHPGLQRSFIWSLRFLLVGICLRLIDEPLGFPDLVEVVVLTTSFLCIVISVTVLLLILVNLAASHFTRTLVRAGNNITLVSLVAGVLRVAIVVIGLLVLADLLGVPYQGVLAGLGIGGLAVALAAQSTLQNFISGITLYFDKPIAIGDFCKFGNREGTVEFIGMRSTRIRTLDRTLVTVPNSEFSNMQLENFAKRDRILLNTTLQVRYETTPDQLRYLIAEIRKLLIAHPKVAADPLRVRFSEFGSHSLDISIFAYVLTNNRSEFMAIKEDVFLRMMDVVERAGAQFAFPSMVYYEAQDTAHDPSKVKAAEDAVSKWRETNNLPFPDLAWQEKAELSGTLDYPPEGSSVAENHVAQGTVSPKGSARASATS